MNHRIEDALMFYSLPGPVTNAGNCSNLLQNLPDTVSELVPILQNLMVHIFWSKRYGLALSKEREAEVQLRSIKRQLERMIALDNRPLTEPRSPELRLVGNCRDFSTLLTGILRFKGIPARARCGFATYFIPGHFEDHWVVETWNPAEDRWVMVDAQLDKLQQEVLHVDFDPLDMPPGKFLVAGEAWPLCRQSKANPDHFGIFEYKGWDFIRGNVLRDFLSLNKIEILPWDFWAPMSSSLAEGTPDDFAKIDHISSLTAARNIDFEAVRALYQGDSRLHVPDEWIE